VGFVPRLGEAIVPLVVLVDAIDLSLEVDMAVVDVVLGVLKPKATLSWLAVRWEGGARCGDAKEDEDRVNGECFDSVRRSKPLKLVPRPLPTPRGVEEGLTLKASRAGEIV
jgi:hypothetical protein